VPEVPDVSGSGVPMNRAGIIPQHRPLSRAERVEMRQKAMGELWAAEEVMNTAARIHGVGSDCHIAARRAYDRARHNFQRISEET
jgi:hypothetical protein